MKKGLIILLALLMVMALVPTAALAAAGTTYRVWDSAQLATAISNAHDGDTIFLYDGNYGLAPKTIISKDIAITGESESGVVIKPTGNTTASSGVNDNRGWIVINSGVTLDLSKLTLDGSGYTINQGIRSNGTLKATNVTVKNISGGGSAGQGIVVLGANNILKNITMSEINRVGIGIYNSTSINGYNYTGKGSTTTSLDYGIEVGTVDASTPAFTVNITNVTITGSRGTVDIWGSAGILISTYFYAYYGGTNPNLVTVTLDHITVSNCAVGLNVGYTEGYYECSNTTITNSNFFENGTDLAFYGKTPGSGTFTASGNYYGGDAPIAYSVPGLTIAGLETYSTTPIAMNQSTEVTAAVDPTYMIVIPAAVNFGTLQKGLGEKSEDFDVKAQDVIIEKGNKIVVSVASDFKLASGGGALLGYQLYSGINLLNSGSTFATFNDASTWVDGVSIQDGNVVVDTGLIENAGNYQDTMTFTIAYQ